MAGVPFHVAVIGGGLGGLCLAQGLAAAGVSVAVYERDGAPTERAGRYRIHVNPVGSQALEACLPPQLWEIFLRTAARAGAGCGFVTEQLRELVVVDDEVMGRSDPAAGHHAVSRAALRHLLLAGLGDAVHFGKRFERFERRAGGGIAAVFADGTSALADVLVGADGANSRVRRQYLPHARRVETGAVGVTGKLPLTSASRAWLPEMLRSRLNTVFPPRHFLFTAVFDRHETRGAASDPTSDLTAGMIRAAGLDPALLLDGEHDYDYVLWTFIADRAAYPAHLRDLDGHGLRRLVGELTAGWHPALRRLVAESDPDGMMLTVLKSSVPPAPWATTEVTLLGDAIHSMSPAGGIGGNTALRDASLLAAKLAAAHRGELPLLDAIKAYEAEMRAYGFGAVREALRNTRLASTTSRAARTAARTWFRFCGTVPALKRLTFGNALTENTAPRQVRAAIR